MDRLKQGHAVSSFRFKPGHPAATATGRGGDVIDLDKLGQLKAGKIIPPTDPKVATAIGVIYAAAILAEQGGYVLVVVGVPGPEDLVAAAALRAMQSQAAKMGIRLVSDAAGTTWRMFRGTKELTGPAAKEIGTVLKETYDVTADLLAELRKAAVKHTPEDIVRIAKDSSDKIKFLEKGGPKAGLEHIIKEHGSQFAKAGIPQAQIPDAVIAAVTRGRQIGMQGTRPIFEFTFNEKIHRIAVTVGDNGFIVGANIP